MTNDGASVTSALKLVLGNRVTSGSVQVDSGAGYVDSDVRSKLIRTACWAMKQEGLRCQLIEGFGASDSRFFSDVFQVFDIGPVGDNLHGSNEWVSLSSIGKNSDFFLRLLKGLKQSPDDLT
jgi:succinyl-diaminopimelate desuccinylase